MSLGLKLKRVVKRKLHWYTITVALAMVYATVMVYHSIGARFESSAKGSPGKTYHRDFYGSNMNDLSEARTSVFVKLKRSRLKIGGDHFTRAGTTSSNRILQQKQHAKKMKSGKEIDNNHGKRVTDSLISMSEDANELATRRAGLLDTIQTGNVHTDEPMPPPIPFTTEPVENEDKILSCPVQEIARKHPIPKDGNEEIACKPHVAPLKACQYTEKAYKIDEKLQTCKDNNNEIYCAINSENQSGEIKFVCNNKHKCDLYTIYSLDWSNGGEVMLHKAQNISYLESLMEKYALKMINQNIYFLFIQCIREPNYPSRTQLIILPARPKKQKQMRGNKLNINIVLLDSLSRAHFYRSLPVVIEMFNDINKGIVSNAEIIDYELFQSVHGHSAENFHALFTGKLLPKYLTDRQKEGANVGIGELYGILKDQGYETMYQDDLCWMYWWGVRMELGMVSNWNELKKAIPQANIDYTGIFSTTFLHSIGLSSFNGQV